MSFINRFSYLIISLALVILGTVAAILLPSGAIGAATFLLGAALLVYWVAARRGARTPVNPGKRIRRARTSERPVVVHFYHDLTIGCLLQRPFTAKAEREYKGRCDIIYVDAYHRDAEPVLAEYEAEVGDWLLFDAAGNLVEKAGSVSVAKLETLVHKPL
ncbi:MAG: hypothetical protein K0R39_1495 [Symbiobacteriaceae bacterium]|jgi:hypothetical protein|nr:hypothetical protein [Symbiobacteriaceae bacterium]